MTDDSASDPLALPPSGAGRHPGRFEQSAIDFLEQAMDALEREQVLPLPWYHPFIRVGTDYFGDSVRNLPGYAALEATLEAEWPTRFATPANGEPPQEFASSYIFPLLEACVSRLVRARERFGRQSARVLSCVTELAEVLSAPGHSVATARLTTELTTVDGAEIEVGPVLVVPASHSREVPGRLARLIPTGPSAFGREFPLGSTGHDALVVARGTGEDPYEVTEQLARTVSRFVLALRLLTASTTLTCCEVRGGTSLLSSCQAHGSISFEGPLVMFANRPTTITEQLAAPLASLMTIIDEATAERPAMFTTSLDMALHKFTTAAERGPWWVQLVDLATALEATIAGQDSADVGLRLSPDPPTLIS